MQDIGAVAIFAGVGCLIYDARRLSKYVPSSPAPPAAVYPGEPMASGSESVDGLQPTPAAASLMREPIRPSSSHDSVLLAVRLAQAARSGGAVRSATSVEELPQYHRLRSPPSPSPTASPQPII